MGFYLNKILYTKLTSKNIMFSIARGVTRMSSKNFNQRALSALARNSQCSSVLPKSKLMPNTLSNTNFSKSISSKVDTEFLSILQREVTAETEHMYEIPTFSGAWKVERNGPDCKLTKKMDNESIEVTFNVNQSVPPLISEDEDEEGEYNDDGYTDDESNFSIRQLTLHDGEITVNDYVIETENMDKDLYSYLLKYLGARGIDNIFSDELI